MTRTVRRFENEVQNAKGADLLCLWGRGHARRDESALHVKGLAVSSVRIGVSGAPDGAQGGVRASPGIGVIVGAAHAVRQFVKNRAGPGASVEGVRYVHVPREERWANIDR